MSIQIIEVNSKSLEREFINLPWRIYYHDKNWVPPLKLSMQAILDTKKHPFYQSSHIKKWIAVKKGEVVGRIAAIINEAHNSYHEEKCGFFGFFESIEDHSVAEALTYAAEKYLKNQGMQIIRGPISPSTNYECGLLVEGFDDPPQLSMTYNPRYYRELLENLNYHKATDLLAYKVPSTIELPEKFMRVARKAESSKKITYRKIRKSQWDKEIQILLEIYNEAWEKNWGFVPVSEPEFKYMAQEFKPICDPNLVWFAEVNGVPAAAIVGLPDYNQVFKRIPSGRLFPFGIFKLIFGRYFINRNRVLLLGVKKKYRHMGINALLMQKYRSVLDEIKRYREVEQSWVLEDNVGMNKPLQLIKAEPYKKYRIFEKSLSKEAGV